MIKTLLILGVLLFLAPPAKANHEAEVTHRLCDAFYNNQAAMRERYGDSLEVMLLICDYVAQLERVVAQFSKMAMVKIPPDSEGTANAVPLPAVYSRQIQGPITLQSPKTMMIFRYYPTPKVSLLEAMTPLGLEIRQEAGLRPENGEILSCTHRTEPFTLGEATKVQANRIRLICGQSEFIVVGIIF